MRRPLAALAGAVLVASVLAGCGADAQGHALGPLAEDIAVVREAVDAQRVAGESGSDGPAVAPFDTAANRLARNCEIYND